jgi:signal transduction histidine kinase
VLKGCNSWRRRERLRQDPWRPAPVQADRELLSHAIYNLLDNALKYMAYESRRPMMNGG